MYIYIYNIQLIYVILHLLLELLSICNCLHFLSDTVRIYLTKSNINFKQVVMTLLIACRSFTEVKANSRLTFVETLFLLLLRARMLCQEFRIRRCYRQSHLRSSCISSSCMKCITYPQRNIRDNRAQAPPGKYELHLAR